MIFQLNVSGFLIEPNILLKNAEALYRTGGFAEAKKLLAPLDIPGQQNANVLRVLGLCLLRLKDHASALGLLERAHSLFPNDGWCALHYGVGLKEVGRPREAVPLFRKAQAMLPADPAPCLNLSAALLELEDTRGAVRAARKGRLYAPMLPHAHYILGRAYLAAGSLGRAADCFRQATRLEPRFVDAWINLGLACYRAHEIEAAKLAMRHAIAIDPDHEAALGNLGGLLRLSGEVEAGEAMLRGAVGRNPTAFGARINLAADLLQEDRDGEALDLLSGTPPAAGDVRQQWFLQRAMAFIKLGRIADARSALDDVGAVSPGLAPLYRWRLTLLAQAEGEHERAAQHVDEMERALAGAPGVMPEHLIMAHYDLARFWSKRREPESAMSHWISGHRILARFQPFSRRDHLAFVDSTIASFDRSRLLQRPRSSVHDATPVFVVGMPRSGTTLVEQILAAHGSVFGAGERSALAQTFMRLGGGTESPAAVRKVAESGSDTLSEAASPYLRELHALDPQADRVVDKMPANYRFLGLIGLMLPGARIISCERDPRDIGLSIFSFRFYGAHGYAHDLSDLGWYIGQQRRLMDHWHSVLPTPILRVRLQDWVEDFARTLSGLLNFLGLPDDPACERFYAVKRRVRTVSRAQVQQPINSRGIGRWRAYEAPLAPLIASLRENGALDGWT